jgi:hypothetical protein
MSECKEVVAGFARATNIKNEQHWHSSGDQLHKGSEHCTTCFEVRKSRVRINHKSNEHARVDQHHCVNDERIRTSASGVAWLQP